MSRVAQIHSFATAILLAATAAACSTSTEAEAPVDFTADTGGAATAAPAEPAVVAEVTSREGATVRFLDERAAEPVISIEIESPASTPVLDALLAQQPTALELYRAIAPGQAAPDALVREHALIAAHDASYGREPRVLSTAGAHASATEDYACGSFASWKTAFDGWAPALDGQYTGTETASSTGYVGYAPKFYFDVCRTTTSNFAFVARTERRTNSSAAWSIYDDGSPLGGNQRYRFFRNTFTCSSYQYRLYVGVPLGGGTYYRGATWADEFSCQIGS